LTVLQQLFLEEKEKAPDSTLLPEITNHNQQYLTGSSCSSRVRLSAVSCSTCKGKAVAMAPLCHAMEAWQLMAFVAKNGKHFWLQNESLLQRCGTLVALQQPFLEEMALAVPSCQKWQTLWLKTESLLQHYSALLVL